MNMLLNESFGSEKILRIGRDEISLTWIHVFLQTELLCFFIEARIVESLLEFFCSSDKPLLWHPEVPPDNFRMIDNMRTIVAYLVIFSVNIYFCVIMVVHGSTMSNEDIENWETESLGEIFMSICVIDPIILTLISLHKVAKSLYNNTPSSDVWMPFKNCPSLLKDITLQWDYMLDDICVDETDYSSEPIDSNIDIDQEVVDNSESKSLTQRCMTTIFNTFRQYFFTLLLIYVIMFTIGSFAVQRLHIKRHIIDAKNIESALTIFQREDLISAIHQVVSVQGRVKRVDPLDAGLTLFFGKWPRTNYY